ncbi:MAG: flavin reductase family protein [Myxococcota bacterium]
MVTDPESFKGALRCWASGVTVVTVAQDGLWFGLTVSSFTSVSLEPPLVSVCLNAPNRACQMIEATGRFAVSILGEGQIEASNWFASSGRDPSPNFGELATDLTQDGLPVVGGAVAWLQCRVHQRVEMGDHSIFMGEVEQAVSNPGAPLLYHNRGYRGVRDL